MLCSHFLFAGVLGLQHRSLQTEDRFPCNYSYHKANIVIQYKDLHLLYRLLDTFLTRTLITNFLTYENIGL